MIEHTFYDNIDSFTYLAQCNDRNIFATLITYSLHVQTHPDLCNYALLNILYTSLMTMLF